MLIENMKILPCERDICTLYKYRPIDEYSINTILSGELYFQKAINLNDPFDCFVDEIIDGDDDDWKKYFKGRNKSIDYINKKLKDIHNKRFNFDKFIREYSSQNYFYVSCFSKEFDNILMWSHYANCHKGICIGYNVTHFNNSLTLKCKDGYLNRKEIQGRNYLPLFRVFYKDERPEPNNILKSSKDKIMEFLYTKSIDWEYEKEYRIILDDKTILKNPVLLDKNEIKEVIFGLKTPEDKKKCIINLINNNIWNNNINLFQMIKIEKKYNLELKRLN